MELSVVLLVGSLVYLVWKGGWWIDATTAMVIAMLFGWEGIKSIRWARNEDFDGGCGDCHSKCKVTPTCATSSTEVDNSKEPEGEENSCSSFSRGCDSKKVGPVNEEQV